MNLEDAFEKAFTALLETQRPDGLLCVQAVDHEIEFVHIMRDGASTEDEIRMLEAVREEIEARVLVLRSKASGPVGSA